MVELTGTADLVQSLGDYATRLAEENKSLRAVMRDALRIMECVPSSPNDHRPIELIRVDMRALLAAAEQPMIGKPR